MKRLAVVALLAACHHAPRPATPGTNADLEARVKKLEATNARYAEALEFLQAAYQQNKERQDAEEANTLAEDGIWAVDITDDLKAGQVDGPATAGVTIIKAFDFACPYCNQVSGTLDELVKEHHGDVRVVYKNLVVHPTIAMSAHLASCGVVK